VLHLVTPIFSKSKTCQSNNTVEIYKSNVGANLKSKGRYTGIKNHFCAYLRQNSKVSRFTSNQDENDPGHYMHIIVEYISMLRFVIFVTSFTYSALECRKKLIFYGDLNSYYLLLTTVNGEIILR